MANSYSDFRNEYEKDGLTRSNLNNDPFKQLNNWIVEVMGNGEPEPTAMSLSSVDTLGQPHSRIVLLKGLENDGLRFFTNYKSDKGSQMSSNNKVAALFFWPLAERQVRVEGQVQKVSDDISDTYFFSRPRESQIGAWASPQSKQVGSYEDLADRYTEIEKRFEGQDVPRPPFWGGYCIVPHSFEFWQGRPGRMHQRYRYTLNGASWEIKTLAP
jgi:pyridoxamine 5'-phosphate oxidase